ncbi:Kinesin-like protein KAR3 [Nakaseomyces bracarensis]|uniref:Kinesin-like protein KAR3 n=1 Tax=Nakaseomyces bracarensis TaxID=273131 RepID=A0ABR4P0Z4_9SACH
MNEIPRTPARQTIGDLSGSAKRRYTTTPPREVRNFPTRNSFGGISRLSSSGVSELAGNEVQDIRSKTHLTSFYKENVLELNTLQDKLFQKKGVLDGLKDEFEDLRTRYEGINLQCEQKKEDKILKKQKLELKEKELKKIKEEFANKKKYMEEGHKLKLEQIVANKKAELAKIDDEYRTKLEQLKYEKIKKFEAEKAELIEKIEEIRNKMNTNEITLAQRLKDCEAQHLEEKEKWLSDYQDQWRQYTEKNHNYSKNIKDLEHEIESVLTPRIEGQKERLRELQDEIDKLNITLKDKQENILKLKDMIKEETEKKIKLLDEKREIVEYIDKSKREVEEIQEILVKEESLRRSLHNQLQELRGNIRVYCRIRPPLPSEDQKTDHISVETFDDDNGDQAMEIRKGVSQNIKFRFDKIFNQNESNKEIFKEVGQLVQSSLDGYNVCIFAYGQTGSGKTYTMLHPKDGIIPATINHIFTWIDKLATRGWTYKVSCEFIEIYNENIVDLLRNSHSSSDSEENPSSLKHEIRHDQESKTTYITNITTCDLDSLDTVSSVLKRANKLRSTASTAANEHSSRSHSIFIIHLEGENKNTGEKSQGILNLVDLAGSERLNSSQVAGDRLRETQNINRSLSCLGDVIHALNTPDSPKRHIPFRNSKLTYLLQYSLIGSSKTLMFVNISPTFSHVSETINSLRFASKVNSTKMVNRN